MIDHVTYIVNSVCKVLISASHSFIMSYFYCSFAVRSTAKHTGPWIPNSNSLQTFLTNMISLDAYELAAYSAVPQLMNVR